MRHIPRVFRTIILVLAVLFAIAPEAVPLASSPRAAQSRPQLMPPHPRLWPAIAAGKLRAGDRVVSAAEAAPRQSGRATKRTGTLKALAVLVDFSDQPYTTTIQSTFFDNLVFDQLRNHSRDSVRDYYNEVSYGQVDIVTVNLPSALGWKRAPHPLSYYTNGESCTGNDTSTSYPHNCQKLAEDVIAAIDSVVDFSQYDNDGDGVMEPLMIIHAGRGAEYTNSGSDIWSHSWSTVDTTPHDGVTVTDYVTMPEYYETPGDMSVGVFAHEMGHGFWNLPDLYDRDYSSYGIGDWSLMSGGSWNGNTHYANDGSSPAWPDAWCRVQMGFVTPQSITSSVTSQSIPQAYNNPSAATVLKLRTANMGSQEYFLLENRQKVSGSYDEYLPGSGLLIWHVDEAMSSYSLWNNYECTAASDYLCSHTQHYLVSLEQADGTRHLEKKTNQGDSGDPYPGSGNTSFGASTSPNSGSWYAASSGISIANISSSGSTMTADLTFPTNNLVNKVHLPFASKAIASSPWTTITSQDFEGSSLGAWATMDNDGSTNGTYTWAKSTCRAANGSASGWAVGGGADGSKLGCGSNYPNNADSWLYYGPFSLTGATAAELNFNLWLYSESNYDKIFIGASTDGEQFYGTRYWGNSQGWTPITLDLSNVYNLGSLLGQSNVWVALVFVSDDTINYAEGAYADDIVVRKCTSGTCTSSQSPAAAGSLGDAPATLTLHRSIHDQP